MNTHLNPVIRLRTAWLPIPRAPAVRWTASAGLHLIGDVDNDSRDLLRMADPFGALPTRADLDALFEGRVVLDD